MPSSTPALKFLLDENVKKVLYQFLVTNDWDFEWYTKDQIYSVIILRIPQYDSKSLWEEVT